MVKFLNRIFGNLEEEVSETELSESDVLAKREDAQSVKTRQILLIFYYFCVGILFDYIRPVLAYTMVGTGKALVNELYFYILPNLIALVLSLSIIFLVRDKFIHAPALACAFASVGFINFIFKKGGIITVVWHGTFGFIVFVLLLIMPLLIYEQRKCTNKAKYGSKHKEDLLLVIKMVVQFALAFGAILGVTMTILFKDGYQEVGTKINAIQMVVGYGLNIGALYLWVIVPIFKGLEKLRIN